MSDPKKRIISQEEYHDLKDQIARENPVPGGKQILTVSGESYYLSDILSFDTEWYSKPYDKEFPVREDQITNIDMVEGDREQILSDSRTRVAQSLNHEPKTTVNESRPVSQQTIENLRRIVEHTIATGERIVFTPTGMRSSGIYTDIRRVSHNLCTEITLNIENTQTES